MRKNNDLPITFLFLAVIMLLLGIFVAKASADSSVGTIEIPSINAKFDLSFFAKDANAHQHIAMLYKTYGCQTVGNHYASASETGGYWKLENLHVGDKAYLEYITMDGMETIHHTGKYVCYAIMICDVVDFDYYHNGKEVRPFDPTDLLCVTCVGSDSARNYVAVFERVS